jgi:hypothetical protein
MRHDLGHQIMSQPLAERRVRGLSLGAGNTPDRVDRRQSKSGYNHDRQKRLDHR